MRIALLAIVCAAAVTAHAQVNLDTIAGNAAKIITDGQPKDELSVGIIMDGKVYKYNYGTATSETIYELGSITKTFTTYLLTQAVVEKRVKLDDDIRKYLKGDYPNLEYKGKPIEFVNLVNWTSSLPNNIPDLSDLAGKIPQDSLPGRIVAMNAHYTRTDFLRDLHQVKLDTPPGATPV